VKIAMLRRFAIRAGLIGAGATLVGVFFAAQTSLANTLTGRGPGWHDALVLALAEWYLWAPLVPVLIWLSRRFPIDRRHWLRSALVHVPGSLMFAVLHLYLYAVAARMLMPSWTYRPLEIFQVMFGAKFSPGFLTYWVIVGAASAFDFYQRFRERELRASRLEAQITQAQLSLLKMQLHPHFLFNTLHSISALMHRDVDLADRMLARLGDLLRLSLDSLRIEEVPLRQELDFLSHYVEIEKMRFEDRLDVRVDVARSVLDAAVPNLILQPLVENAIRYGIAGGAAPCRVVVAAHQDNGALRISVTDNGPGLSRDARSANVAGLGLANTRARLAQLYNGGGRLELEDAPGGGLRVSISIPFHMPPAAESDAPNSVAPEMEKESGR
jgi:signal transduction histidine kinase